jgi:hypothetical protein
MTDRKEDPIRWGDNYAKMLMGRKSTEREGLTK